MLTVRVITIEPVITTAWIILTASQKKIMVICGPSVGAISTAHQCRLSTQDYCERGGLPVIRGADVSQYADLLTDIYALLLLPTTSGMDMRINGKLNDLLTLLMESSWHQGNSSNVPKKMDISIVKFFLDEHYSEKLSLESVVNLLLYQ